MIDTGETTANLAKGVNYCSKYGSIGIDRNPDCDYQTNEELKKFLESCPECGKSIHHKMNVELEKYKLGQELGIKIPLIK